MIDNLKRFGWSNWSLVVQLTVTRILLIAVTVIGITWVSLRREQANFQAELENQADLALNVLEESSANALYQLDADSIEEIVLEFEDTGFVVKIYDENGRLIAETQHDNPLRFSLETDAFAMRVLQEDSTVYDWQSEQLVAAKPVRIGRVPVGVASVVFSTAPLDAKIADVQRSGVEVALLAMLLGAIVSIVLSRTITVPLTDLAKATEHIAQGNWSHQVPVHGSAELKKVGTSFNAMVGQLRQREAQIVKTTGDLAVEVEERKRAEEAARNANQLKSNFLANMSHELRTPLNAIIGFSDVMLLGMGSDPLTSKQNDQVTRIRDNSSRLLTLINDILDISRIESGRMELVNRPVDVRKLVQNITNQMQSLANEKKLEFAASVDDSLPPSIVGDEKRLEQIVVNLLSNAFKFTKAGSVILKVTCENQMWQLTVRDTGIGIPPHAQETIFEPFRQVDGSSTREYGGVGLGLAITHELVRLMNGQIQLESKRGEGSTFTITLPLISVEQSVKSAG